MGDEAYTVCGHCSAQVRDPASRRCPHCLESLSVRRFHDRAALLAFREDRKAHGVEVPDDAPGQGRPAMASLLAVAGMVLTLGAIGLGLASYWAGGLDQLVQAVGQIFPMILFGLAMAVVARKMRGEA
jgi:hypothetical protein